MGANPDFKELFAALCDQKAEFFVVGAHAVMVHTEPRYTKDLDIWVRPTPDNAKRVFAAFRIFGASLWDLTEQDLYTKGVVFQIGIEPNRINILTAIDGVEFEDAWERKLQSLYDQVPINLLSIQDLIQNKSTTKRKQDLIDLENLKATLKEREGHDR